MKVTLKQQMCGHVAGAVVGVSDDRAYLWMVNGIAEPDRSFLEARKRETDRLLKKAEKAAEAAAAEEKKTRHNPKRMSKKELRAFLGDGNYPEDANKKGLVELAEKKFLTY